MAHMREIKSWSAIAGVALMPVGIAGWAKSNNRRLLKAQASTRIEGARIDPFQIMLDAQNLLSEEL